MTAQNVVKHGRYDLVDSLSGGMIIRRQDEGRKRTVAFVASLTEWDRFVAALERGDDEVAAVHAIDA